MQIILFSALILTTWGLSEQDQWISFKQIYQKSYSNLNEEKTRFHTFKSNLRKIEEHNAKYLNGETTYFMGINNFADLSANEFHDMFLRHENNKPEIQSTLQVFAEGLKVPESIDWRDRGAVLEVENQRACGAGWAFSVTGALEGQNAIRNNVKISLSNQELVDCSSLYGNYGCSGGLKQAAYEYIQRHGIQSEVSYTYIGKEGRCRKSANETVLKVKEYKWIEKTEEALKNAIATIGPVSVSIFADFLQHYNGGIFSDPHCQNNEAMLNFDSLVVGYGVDNGTEYWLLKNSWGKYWGEDGYFRLHRNPTVCGILLNIIYPILN